MEQIELKGVLRKKTGSAEARRIRRRGFVPGVLYGREEKPLHLKVSLAGLHKAISGGENVIINLKIDEKAETVMVKEIQRDPVDDQIVHVDFYRVSLREEVKVNVPVEITGEAKGVREKGGVLEQILREIEIKCLPGDIPERITVDVSELDIGDSITVEQLKLPAKVTVLSPPDATVAVVIAPTVLREEEKPVEEAVEPELIGKKEKIEEAGEEKEEAIEGKESSEKASKEEKKKE